MAGITENKACVCDAVDFGVTKYGEAAHLWTIAGKGGLEMAVTDYGGRVSRLRVPDGEENLVDVTVGFDDVSGWENTDRYFGAIIGRVCNRIAEGRFALDGKEYELYCNDSKHNASLHGGKRGWDSYVWDAKPFLDGEDAGIIFSKVFQDGEEGYPGNMNVSVKYTITADNTWRIEYDAVTDKATPINMTQHVYFNLDGSGTILGHEMKIHASRYLPVNANLAPVGSPAPVDGTPFDFREFNVIGTRIDDSDEILRHGPGYDHNWCLDGDGMRNVAELRGKNLAMEVWTDQIGMQFYAGNFIRDEWTMKDGIPMKRRGWLALETQHYPNTPNRPDFPGITLNPGERYRTATEYRFKLRR